MGHVHQFQSSSGKLCGLWYTEINEAAVVLLVKVPNFKKKKTLFHAMSQHVLKMSSGTIMRVLEFCEEKSFSHHTKNNALALSSCHVKICSSGSPNASDISMLSSGLKNVLTTSHPAVKELIQTPMVNKPSASN